MSRVIEPPQSVPAEAQPFQEQFVPIMRLFWHFRWWLARLAAGGLVISTILAFVLPKEYESKVQLMPPDPQQSLSSMALMTALSGMPASAGASGIASTLLGIKSTGAMVVAVLKSRTVQDDLINRFDLRKVYRHRYYADARKELAKNTELEEDKQSGVITIAVTDRDPRRARDLAQAYVDELDDLLSRLSTSSARRERVFLEQRLTAVKQDLDDSSRQLSEFSSKNATFDVQNQAKAMIEAAAKLQGELIVAESEVRALEPMYSDENVRLRSARMRVAELRRQLQKMGGTSATANSSGSSADELYPPLRKMPLLGVTYYDLYRRVKIQETLYEILTKEYELAKVQEAKEIPTVKVLDSANVPEKKSFPPRLLIILLGTWLTLISGLAWIVVKEAWHRTGDAEPSKVLFREVFASWSAWKER